MKKNVFVFHKPPLIGKRKCAVLTQFPVLIVCPPFLMSEGTDPLFLGQNQTLMKLLFRSMANHPPPLLLNEGPKLFHAEKVTPQPVLLLIKELQSNWPLVL